MAARALRRSNPITLLLGLLLFLGFLIFMITPSSPSVPRVGSKSRKSYSPYDAPPVVHYYLNNLTTSSEPIKNREKVLLLTPLARFYDEYWANLMKLNYPHDLIELGFIVPKTREGNAALVKLEEAVKKVQTGKKKDRFSGVTIIRQDFDTPVAQSEKDRHALAAQKARRAAMSRARNSLLYTTLGTDTAWVMWLDADIIETPPTLIQDLAKHDRAVIVPNCFQRYVENGVKKVRPYDYNSWHESNDALDMAAKMGRDEIILEGYKEMATWRSLMAYERQEGQSIHTETTLDGVGGTALLVKAEVHRDGAMFPPFAFYNLIETEGFAKMAKRLGHQPYGLPNYLVGFLAHLYGKIRTNRR
jgi:mannan polymerase complexes MNN9 subunit